MNFLKTVIAGIFLIASTLSVTAGSSIKEVMESTVRVSDFKGGSGSGTVLYSKETKRGVLMYIITNYHVVAEAVDDFMMVSRYHDSFDHQGATVVAVDTSRDLALLRVHNRRHKAPYAWPSVKTSSEPLEMGNVIMISGYPLGKGPLVTPGFYSRTDFFFDNAGHKQMMTSAMSFFGNSGGGLYARKDDGWYYVGTPQAVGEHTMPVRDHPSVFGNVIGTAFFPVSHVSYAIPLAGLVEFLENNNYEWILQ